MKQLFALKKYIGWNYYTLATYMYTRKNWKESKTDKSLKEGEFYLTSMTISDNIMEKDCIVRKEMLW